MNLYGVSLDVHCWSVGGLNVQGVAVDEAVGDRSASHAVAVTESWELLGEEAFVVEEGALGSSLQLPRSTRSSFADRTRCPVTGNPDESWTDTPRYAHFSTKYKFPGTHFYSGLAK